MTPHQPAGQWLLLIWEVLTHFSLGSPLVQNEEETGGNGRPDALGVRGGPGGMVTTDLFPS